MIGQTDIIQSGVCSSNAITNKNKHQKWVCVHYKLNVTKKQVKLSLTFQAQWYQMVTLQSVQGHTGLTCSFLIC